MIRFSSAFVCSQTIEVQFAHFPRSAACRQFPSTINEAARMLIWVFGRGQGSALLYSFTFFTGGSVGRNFRASVLNIYWIPQAKGKLELHITYNHGPIEWTNNTCREGLLPFQGFPRYWFGGATDTNGTRLGRWWAISKWLQIAADSQLAWLRHNLNSGDGKWQTATATVATVGSQQMNLENSSKRCRTRVCYRLPNPVPHMHTYRYFWKHCIHVTYALTPQPITLSGADSCRCRGSSSSSWSSIQLFHLVLLHHQCPVSAYCLLSVVCCFDSGQPGALLGLTQNPFNNLILPQ